MKKLGTEEYFLRFQGGVDSSVGSRTAFQSNQHVFGLQDSIGLTIAILLMIAAVYTFTVWFGMKGIAKLAAICSYCFFALLAYVLFGGGETRYILETGFSAIGNLVQNFIGLSTWMDPLRKRVSRKLDDLLLGILDGLVALRHRSLLA